MWDAENRALSNLWGSVESQNGGISIHKWLHSTAGICSFPYKKTFFIVWADLESDSVYIFLTESVNLIKNIRLLLDQNMLFASVPGGIFTTMISLVFVL